MCTSFDTFWVWKWIFNEIFVCNVQTSHARVGLRSIHHSFDLCLKMLEKKTCELFFVANDDFCCRCFDISNGFCCRSMLRSLSYDVANDDFCCRLMLWSPSYSRIFIELVERFFLFFIIWPILETVAILDWLLVTEFWDCIVGFQPVIPSQVLLKRVKGKKQEKKRLGKKARAKKTGAKSTRRQWFLCIWKTS